MKKTLEENYNYVIQGGGYEACKVLENVYYAQHIYGYSSKLGKERLLLEDGKWNYCKENSFDIETHPGPTLSEFIFYVDFEEYKLLTVSFMDSVDLRNCIYSIIANIEYEKYGKTTAFTKRCTNNLAYAERWAGDVFKDDFVEMCFDAGSYTHSIYRNVSARKFLTTPIEVIESNIFFGNSGREYLDRYCPNFNALTFREKAKIMIDRMCLATTDNPVKTKFKIIKPLKFKAA